MIVTCTVVETNSASVSIHTQGKIEFKKTPLNILDTEQGNCCQIVVRRISMCASFVGTFTHACLIAHINSNYKDIYSNSDNI